MHHWNGSDFGSIDRVERFPLYPEQAVLRAHLADRPMHDAAALVDAIRGGSARERQGRASTRYQRMRVLAGRP